MRSVLLSLAILLLAGVAFGQDVATLNNFTTGTVISSSQMNTNFDNVENSVNAVIGNTFYAENYATGSNSGGLYEAVQACEATTDGGVVVTHSNGTVAIDMNNPNTAITLTKCSLRGLGGELQTVSPYQAEGASHYLLTNTNGRTFITVLGNELSIDRLAISSRDESATTEIIHVGSVTGIANVVIDRVFVAGSGGSSPLGTGLVLEFALKSHVSNSEFRRYNKAVSIQRASNATTISNTGLRNSDVGVWFDANSSISSDFVFLTNTIEANRVGLYAEAGTTFRLADFGTHYEQTGGAVQADRANIEIDSAGFSYHGKGIHFGGTLDAGQDFVRNVAIFTDFGNDSIENVRWGAGATLNATGATARLTVRDNRSTGSPGSVTFSGNVVDDSTFIHATDCAAGMVARGIYLQGARCYEADSGQWYTGVDSNGDLRITTSDEVLPLGLREVFRATCATPGSCTDSDIEAAFTACTTAAPTGGCIIELLDETYTDVRLEVPKLVREIRSAGDNTILQGPTSISMPDAHGNNTYSMIEIRPGGGSDRFEHGLWIHGFTMDGNKQNLAQPGGEQEYLISHAHRGLEVDDPTAIRLNGLVIEDMHVKNFMNEGIILQQTSKAVVRNNFVENVGCWDSSNITPESNNGDTLSDDYTEWRPGDPGVNQLAAGETGCGQWGAAQTQTARPYPNSGYQPGVLAEGTGIEIGCHSDNTVVENNTIRYSTKLGIQTFCQANFEVSGYSPEHVKIVNNDVSWIGSAAGILTLGSNFTIVDGNAVSNILAPWLYGSTGKGISCNVLGRYNRFTNNTITNTAGVGLQPSCGCGQFTGDVSPADGNPDGPFVCNALAANNTIINPCSQDLTPEFTCNAISLNTSLSGGDLPPANQSEGLTLHNNKVIQPGAYTVAGFADEGVYSDLSITGDIASGSTQITNGATLIGANSCTSAISETAPEVAATDSIDVTFNQDATLILGYGPGATEGIAIYAWPDTDQVNFKACNLTSSGITPGALTVNWRVTR
jgi:hypothetical protein